MRAQNEPLETVVRVRRRRPPAGERTDCPDALRVDRVDERVDRGASGRRAAARSSPGLAVGAREGRAGRSTSAPRPAARRGSSRARSRRSRARGRARELRGEPRGSGRATSRWSKADGTALPPELSGFDRALVDAPCSGLGVLARRPDLRWRARPLPELQLELLRAAAERVRPGGTVVYAVCTINATRTRRSSTHPVSRSTRRSATSGRARASAAAGVPAHAAARPRHEGFFVARLRVADARAP